MPTFSNIDIEESSTISASVGTVTLVRGTTNERQEILCLGDPDTSNALAAILNTGPASTAWGLVVREAVPTTSVRVAQSSAADLNVTVAGYSTIATVSTGSVRVHQSTAADLNVTVAGYSTTVNVSSLSGVATVTPVSGSTWTVGHGKDSTFWTGTNSSVADKTLGSSSANRWKVFGYQFTIDSTTPTLIRLLSGSTAELARWQFRAPSSISLGANMAVPMPAWLHRTSTGAGLILSQDSTATVHYTVMGFGESS